MIEACEALTGTPVGQCVAVVGGGLTGCEIAYELALQGKKVAIVEMKDDLIAQTHAICSEEGAPKFTDEQVKAYTTVGGTPFLDNQYTVFGEVTEGLDVVEKIQACETSRADRPVEDISMTVEIVEE